MSVEKGRIVIASSDRVFERDVEPRRDVPVENSGQDTWGMSFPLSAVSIVSVFEIFHQIKVALTRTESNHYQVMRSINGRDYSLVHDHETTIFGIFYIDDGIAVFSATDGWWATTNTGKTWTKINSGPAAKVATTIMTDEDGEWSLVAYGTDRKFYRMVYPGGSWAEIFDSSSIWSGKWYPALVGSPVSLIAGVGPYVIRSEDLGDNWSVVQTFDESEIVKTISAAANSSMPIHLIETDTDGTHKFYWSRNDCDSVQMGETRYDSVASVRSVIPTGGENETPLFAILGKRSEDNAQSYKLISEEVDR